MKGLKLKKVIKELITEQTTPTQGMRIYGCACGAQHQGVSSVAMDGVGIVMTWQEINDYNAIHPPQPNPWGGGPTGAVWHDYGNGSVGYLPVGPNQDLVLICPENYWWNHTNAIIDCNLPQVGQTYYQEDGIPSNVTIAINGVMPEWNTAAPIQSFETAPCGAPGVFPLNCGGPTEWWCSVSGIAGPSCYDTPIGQGPNDPNDYGPSPTQQDCQTQCQIQTLGCTDQNALNFDPQAQIPCDGGPVGPPCAPGTPPGTANCCCDYGVGQAGCPDPNALNFDPMVIGCPDPMGNPDPMDTSCCTYSTGDYWCEVLPCQIPPCPTQCVGPGPQPPNAVGGPFIDQQDCQANGCGTMGSIAGCNDANCNNFDPNAIGCPDPMGNPDPTDQSCCTGCGIPIPGCLDPSTPNFDPSATVDCVGNPVPPGGGFGDTSCCGVSPILGCMDQNALNFDPSATQDNGTCDYGWMCKQQGNHWKFGKKCKKNNNPNQPWDFVTKDDCLESGCEPLEADYDKDMVAMAKDNKDYDWMNFDNKTDEKKENLREERERKQELREEFTRMKTLWRHER